MLFKKSDFVWGALLLLVLVAVGVPLQIQGDIRTLNHGSLDTRILKVQTFPAPEMGINKPIPADLDGWTQSVVFPTDVYDRVEVKLLGFDVTERVSARIVGQPVKRLYRLRLCGNWAFVL